LSSFICLKKAAATAGIERAIKTFKAAAPAYHFLVLNISKARMNNNHQRNKRNSASASLQQQLLRSMVISRAK
jgi:hypothetical protein